eukprot:1941018-Prymnesium_polylepis.1
MSPTPLARARRAENTVITGVDYCKAIGERNTSGPSSEHVRHRARTIDTSTCCRARLRSTHRCDFSWAAK